MDSLMGGTGVELFSLADGIGFLLLVGAVIGLFLGHILLFDSIAISLISGLSAYEFLHIHPAISLSIGIGLFFFLTQYAQKTKTGFWIIGILMSLFWGFIFSRLIYEYTKDDKVWVIVIFAASFLVMLFMHLKGRKK